MCLVHFQSSWPRWNRVEATPLSCPSHALNNAERRLSDSERRLSALLAPSERPLSAMSESDKEKAMKGGIFNDAKSFVAATSRVLPDVPADASLAPPDSLHDEAPSTSAASSSSSSEKPLPSLSTHAGCRLWVGNIDPKIREIHLLKLFQPFGEIIQLDYLFHKSGPLKGEPRGYAFVAFADADSAER